MGGSMFPQGLLMGLMGGMGSGKMGGPGGAPGAQGGGGAMAAVPPGGQPMGGQRPPMAGGKDGQPRPQGQMAPMQAQPQAGGPSSPMAGAPMGGMQAPLPPPRPPGIGIPAVPPIPPVRPTALDPGAPASPRPPLAPPAKPAPPMPPVRPTALKKEASLTSDVPASAPDTGAFKSKFPGAIGRVETAIRGQGFNAIGAAGVMAGVKAESAFDPQVVGDKGKSHGLFQFNEGAGRWSKAKREGDVSTAEGQVAIAAKEAKQIKVGNGTLFDAMNNAKSPAEAANLWTEHFEKPAGGVARHPERARYAEDFYKGIYGKRALSKRGGGDVDTSGGATDQSFRPGFKMPEKKPIEDLTAEKADISGVSQPNSEQAKKKEAGEAGGGKGLDVLKTKVEVPEGVKPAENIMAAKYASFQEAIKDKKSTMQDWLNSA